MYVKGRSFTACIHLDLCLIMEVDVIVKTFDLFQIQVAYFYNPQHKFILSTFQSGQLLVPSQIMFVRSIKAIILFLNYYYFYYESTVDKSDYSMPIHILQNKP